MLVSSNAQSQRNIRATSDPSLTLDLLVRLGVSSDESVSLEANDVRTEAMDPSTWRAKATMSLADYHGDLLEYVVFMRSLNPRTLRGHDSKCAYHAARDIDALDPP
jgi:hypothetical protein